MSVLLLLSLACQKAVTTPEAPPAEPPPQPAGLQIHGAELPQSPGDISIAPGLSFGGQESELAYMRFLTVGEQLGEAAPVGSMTDIRGLPVLDEAGAQRVCNSFDGATLLAVEDEIWSVVHSECHPGALQLSQIDQDERGVLSLLRSAPIDLGPVHGGNLFCAADTTPWQSHMAAEEYEAPADKLLPDGSIEGDWQRYNNMAWYHGGSLEGVSPYRYGWMDELVVEPGGQATVHKRMAMGRFSHELSRVMPDGRTVYLSDDGTNGGFFVFVADTEGDLSSGRLYASRWEQQDPRSHALSWIDLGHASESEIQAAVDEGVRFEDLIERSEDCAEGFTRVHSTHEQGCIRIVEGQELLASRLETRRFAAIQGATTELRKSEGMAFDAETGRLWMALSAITKGSLDGDETWDHPELNHLRMEPNRCGALLEMSRSEGAALDSSGQPIDSEWIVTDSRFVLEGQPDDEDPDNTCLLEGMANPDNIAWVPGHELMLIAEDTGQHQHNVLWAADLETGELTRLAVGARHSEIAGLNWFELNGWGYVTISFQHEDPQWMDEDAVFIPSHSGAIGPFPLGE